MKIIFQSRDSIQRDEHAKLVIANQKKRSLDPRYPESVTPLGVAAHLARVAIFCDECGRTYWAADPWASHRNCKGPNGPAGF